MSKRDYAVFMHSGRVRVLLYQDESTLTSELEQVGGILDRHNVTLWAVESEAAGTQEAAVDLGLEIGLSLPSRAPAGPTPVPPGQGDAILVQRTLRSGQVITHPGHVVVIGDVNPGAEIRAGGSVIVWGRLRGTVHAGLAQGQGENAVVCALQLSPPQLRIGDTMARSPADDGEHEVVPEMASVQGGQIVAEPWK